MKQTVQELTEATHELTAKVEELAESLKVSEAQTRKLRIVAWVLSGVAVLCLIAVVATGFSVLQNKENAVTACENANETRTANLALWTYILDLSVSDGGETPEQVKQLDDLRTWIGQIYEQRDCQDLARKYEIPPAPALPGE